MWQDVAVWIIGLAVLAIVLRRLVKPRNKCHDCASAHDCKKQHKKK